MTFNGFANYPECTFERASGYGGRGNKSSLSQRSQDIFQASWQGEEMNQANQLRLRIAVLLITGGAGILAGPTKAQSSSESQCSLAVVSKLAGKQGNVCETKVVQELAQKGHAFEQNQLGIASMLAIGPDYTDKEALKWFEKAAQKGYAPAQVNLAVMYANGWGTSPNYGAALNWLHAAADQNSARAYTNLGILYLRGQGVHQDYTEAFRWFQKGAEANDSDGETNL